MKQNFNNQFMQQLIIHEAAAAYEQCNSIVIYLGSSRFRWLSNHVENTINSKMMHVLFFLLRECFSKIGKKMISEIVFIKNNNEYKPINQSVKYVS
jgi:hypothetical protein